MKKYSLCKKNKVLSIVAASTVAMNMLFLPPFVPEEKFKIKKKETIEQGDDLIKQKKKQYKEMSAKLLQIREARNALNKPNYYVNSETNISRKR